MASDPKTLTAGEEKERRWQLWALVPIVLLVGAVTLFASTGGSLTGLLGHNPPQLDGPYFHNGSAATLEAVVDRYIAKRNLTLSTQQRADLVQYLRSL